MKKIKFFISIILVLVLIFVWNRYQKTNMNIFTRAEMNKGFTEFLRDDDVKYSEHKSYKLKSDQYNDAMLYTTIKVEPYTVYKVTCMVKTNNVIPKEQNKGAGACISITDSTEQSRPVTGTQDWQMIELQFNSKNRDNVSIGFRLGGNGSDCIGEAWFSDFKIEEGYADTSNDWKFTCIVLKNLDVDVEKNGKKENVKISMNNLEIQNIESDVKRFEKACSTLSGNKMTAKCDLMYIDEPITSITFSEETGYYVSSYDCQSLIDEYVKDKNYDHIFIVIKLDSEKYKDTIEIHNWVGLGYMDYYGTGFSNIRIPSDESKFMYIYDPYINVFPEEVFVHEFLHSLERNSTEYGFETTDLHAYQNYGYKNDGLEGLKDWYAAYMSKKIYDSNTKKYIGLDERVYTLKPVHSNDFTYARELKNVFVEPDNIIEEFKLILQQVTQNLNRILNAEKERVAI